MTIYDVMLTITRLLVGLMFITFALPKVRRPRRFKAVVRNYHILPESMSSLVAHILPVIELATGIMLITNLMVGLAYLISGLLFTAFVVAISINLFRQRDMSCGCSGKSGDKIGWRKVISNSILSILSFTLASVSLATIDDGAFSSSALFATWQTNSPLNTLISRLADLPATLQIGLVAVVVVLSGIGLASVTLYMRHTNNVRHQARQHEIREWSIFAKGTTQIDLLQS
jgi:uncharacterized membrane protein YphA (DoxX/SURF4 family)